MNAIGMIEVFSLVNAITIADECLKTANVNLIGIENVSSGIVTVKITGDVGAVTSSVNSVKNLEKVVYH
ncbi:MAG: BMC domain-containing protein, partial [Eubacteriales bacterium]|nr:BMC domain-containing protein [Eubacteriales bacterium]